jgi:hypothetical protein
VKKSFNIQDVVEPKPMHHSSSRALQRHQEHDLKHPGLVDLITTEQNKTNYLSSEIDICVA